MLWSDMYVRVALLALVAGCWNAEHSTPTPPTNVSTAAPVVGVVPSVEIISDAEWAECPDCDDQSREGGAPLRFKNFPAVTHTGDLIAVAEERDGWGHVPIPGVRLLDRNGKTARWLPIAGADAVTAANAELAKYAWSTLDKPTPKVKELSDTLSETELTFGPYTARYKRRDDGNTVLPPSEIRVFDAAGHALAERTDTETAWNAAPACNLPAFTLVGASASGRVILFMTGLGMGGHDCDGVEERPNWHVLSFRAP